VLDARDVVDGGHDADVVKVLGGGQVRNELAVTADAFTAGAVEAIEGAGGVASLSSRAEATDESSSDDETDEA
jgi:large subunit ribosomal protein L15